MSGDAPAKMNSPIAPRYLRRLVFALVVLLVLLVVGTTGYTILEGFSTVDALYMTVITISTVGFGEIRQLSEMGRIFTMTLIIGGGGLAAFAISTTAESILSVQWREYWSNQRRVKKMKELDNHVIVCGFGRVGRHVSEELKDEGIPFVVVDRNPERIAHAEDHGFLTLEGNAAQEELLLEAGIQRARAAVVAVNSDAENVFIILTARSLNPGLFIVARANYEDSEPKLLRAGANRTIQPYRISGKRMVTMLMRPNVADFLDEVSHAGGMELLLEQIAVKPTSPLAGKTILESQIATEYGVTVLACRGEDNKFHTPPGPETVIQPGTSMVVMGTREQLSRLIKTAGE